MINSNIRTQLQAKINAATAGNTLSELMLLRVAAQGLNLDETNLDTLIAPKVDAVTAAGTAVSFVEAWRSLGLDGNVMYPTSFETQRGDILYVDPMGVAKKSKYPSGVVACTPANTANMNQNYGFTRLGGFNAGLFSAFRAALTLSDGNHLILASYTVNANSIGLTMSVVDSAFEAVLQDATALPLLNSVASTAYSRFIGAFETSANVFRVYYACPQATAEATGRVIGYFNLTYNTATKQVTYSAGAVILTESSGDFGVGAIQTVQGQRYVPLKRDSNSDTYSLDMQTSTVVKYTALTGKDTTLTPFDHGSTGNEFARLVNTTDGITQLIKAGVNTVQSLPANLTSDGCFSAANTTQLIGTGMWLCYNSTTRVIKLVKFNAGYTTCDIYTVGTLAAPAPVFPLMTTLQADLYTVYGDGIAVSFRWTGTSAPTRINMNQRFANVSAPPSDAVHLVTATTQYVAQAAGITEIGTPNLAAKCYIKFDKSEFLPMGAQPFAVVIEGAAGGSLSEVALLVGSYKSPSITAAINAVHHNGVVTTLTLAEPSLTGGYHTGSPAPEWDADLYKCRRNGIEASNVNGVFAVGESVVAAATCNRIDVSVGGYATALTTRGKREIVSNPSSASNVAHAIVATRSVAALIMYGSDTKVFKEGAL
jgi:hypothetical protein